MKRLFLSLVALFVIAGFGSPVIAQNYHHDEHHDVHHHRKLVCHYYHHHKTCHYV